MTYAQVAFTLRSDGEESTEFEYVRAFALVCQDPRDEYVCMHGPSDALRDLYCWGLLNFGFASPLPELVNAVDTVLRPEIGDDDARADVRVPTTLPSSAAPDALDAPWTMDVRVDLGDERIVLTGMTDLILMLTDGDGEKKIAAGGSGIQKSALAELGIAALFGNATAKLFERAYRGETSPLFRDLQKKVRRATRDKGPRGPGVSVGTLQFPLDDDE